MWRHVFLFLPCKRAICKESPVPQWRSRLGLLVGKSWFLVKLDGEFCILMSPGERQEMGREEKGGACGACWTLIVPRSPPKQNAPAWRNKLDRKVWHCALSPALHGLKQLPSLSVKKPTPHVGCTYWDYYILVIIMIIGKLWGEHWHIPAELEVFPDSFFLGDLLF